MVKKAIVTAMAVISLFTLMGCNNRAEVDTLSPAQAAELKPMPQSWRGVLPCADCEGIETSLFTYRKLKNQSIPLSTPYAT
ncbi:copper resistance protein NlpE N-terminal domain-containing protein [Escherichia coli]